MTPDLLPDRLASSVTPEPMSGCWLWTDHLCNGYGHPRWGGKHRYAHVVVYELLVGSVPAGLELDHLCRNRACCSPWHVEPVTDRVNILRGEGVGAKHARQTHCVRGHPFDEENTRYGTGNYGVKRICRECTRERRDKLARRVAAGDPTVVHGSISTYQNGKCRCEACRAVNTEYFRRRRSA